MSHINSTAVLPEQSYLNAKYGLKSWLLTRDHKRIAVLYLISVTLMFVVGGTYAALVRLESGDRASPCAHMRAGHPRKLSSGNLTWVRPCWVNPRLKETAA